MTLFWIILTYAALSAELIPFFANDVKVSECDSQQNPVLCFIQTLQCLICDEVNAVKTDAQKHTRPPESFIYRSALLIHNWPQNTVIIYSQPSFSPELLLFSINDLLLYDQQAVLL